MTRQKGSTMNDATAKLSTPDETQDSGGTAKHEAADERKARMTFNLWLGVVLLFGNLILSGYGFATWQLTKDGDWLATSIMNFALSVHVFLVIKARLQDKFVITGGESR